MFNDSDALKALKTDLVYIHANFSFLIATHNEVENDVSIARNNKINNQRLGNRRRKIKIQ
jgi:hypothetical protein